MAGVGSDVLDDQSGPRTVSDSSIDISFNKQGASHAIARNTMKETRGQTPLTTITGTTLTNNYGKDPVDPQHVIQSTKPHHAVQSSTVRSAAAGSSTGGGRSWKVNSKLFRDKKKKASSIRLDKELREISLSNRCEDLLEMEESEYSDYSEDFFDDPIVETTKNPKRSNVITRQQARLQHL